MSHGQRVGIFSSPYISNYHEQIQINFEPINDNDYNPLSINIKI